MWKWGRIRDKTIKYCKCRRIQYIKISSTKVNPNMLFYTCKERTCDFFLVMQPNECWDVCPLQFQVWRYFFGTLTVMRFEYRILSCKLSKLLTIRSLLMASSMKIMNKGKKWKRKKENIKCENRNISLRWISN